MRSKANLALWAAALLVLAVAFVVTGCAAQYHQPDRQPVTATTPLPLPAWPDAVHVVCPRGHWDRLARCPWGSEWVAYDAAAADQLLEFVIVAEGNTEIAAAQAEQLRALDAEAAAANQTAAKLEAELAGQGFWRWIERLGWAGALTLLLWGAL